MWTTIRKRKNEKSTASKIKMEHPPLTYFYFCVVHVGVHSVVRAIIFDCHFLARQKKVHCLLFGNSRLGEVNLGTFGKGAHA